MNQLLCFLKSTRKKSFRLQWLAEEYIHYKTLDLRFKKYSRIYLNLCYAFAYLWFDLDASNQVIDIFVIQPYSIALLYKIHNCDFTYIHIVCMLESFYCFSKNK